MDPLTVFNESSQFAFLPPFIQRDFASLQRVLSPQFVMHSDGQDIQLQQYIALKQEWYTAFPDMKITSKFVSQDANGK